MKKYGFPNRWFRRTLRVIIITLLVMVSIVSASEEQSQSYHLTIPTTAPGFVLLGSEPATVERPGSVTDFILSIQNQTEDFSVLPKNYALELAPYWLLLGSHITYEQYVNGRNLMANMLQTLSLSVATVSSTFEDSLGVSHDMTSLGFGFRFSLLRGKVEPSFQNYANRLDSIYSISHTLSDRVTEEIEKRLKNDTVLCRLDSVFQNAPDNARQLLIPIITVLQSQRQQEIKNEVEKEIREEYTSEFARISGLVSRLQMRRVGWKLELAGGAAMDFPERTFDNSNWSKLGIWTTFGYEQTHWGMLGLVRILGDQRNDDFSSIDIGSRFIIDNIRLMSISVESVYRTFYASDKMDDTWRLAFMLDYPLGKNKSLSLVFGRDFEGSRSGNLISLINVVISLGSDRPI